MPLSNLVLPQFHAAPPTRASFHSFIQTRVFDATPSCQPPMHVIHAF
jgi:hypothetical protein